MSQNTQAWQMDATWKDPKKSWKTHGFQKGTLQAMYLQMVPAISFQLLMLHYQGFVISQRRESLNR